MIGGDALGHAAVAHLLEDRLGRGGIALGEKLQGLPDAWPFALGQRLDGGVQGGYGGGIGLGALGKLGHAGLRLLDQPLVVADDADPLAQPPEAGDDAEDGGQRQHRPPLAEPVHEVDGAIEPRKPRHPR